MSGTEWTEPGQGATCGQLLNTMHPRNKPIWKPRGVRRLALENLVRIDNRYPYETRTNLRLTGHPLTAEDLQNIAEAK
jgi:hypothetical protein